MAITGGCLCRAVRYEASATPVTARACWCRLCQYLATGNASVNVCFPSAAVSWRGELRDYPSIADSGNVMHRRFCPTCGTHVFSAAESRPQLLFIRAGTLDDREIARPLMTIWTAQAPSWAHIDPDVPSLPGQAPSAALTPT
jgi:hypothetical protein